MTFKVPFVNYVKHYKSMENEIDNAIKRTLNTGQLILRQDVEDFEKDFAKFVGTKHAVACNSGTDALLISLLAAGIKKGDEVITVSHTFMATISTIVYAGATPVLIDVKHDFCMDENLIEKAITKKTKAIIPVQFNGRLCNMEKIMKIAKKHKLIVIEDACQALGATQNGKNAGSFGLTGCFSFYPAKILGACGDGGAITTDSDKIAKLARLYGNHGRKTKDKFALFGFTSRMDNLQAAILNVKLKYVEQWIDRRIEIADLYYRMLRCNDSIVLPSLTGVSRKDVFQNFVIRVDNRDKLTKYLRNNGVEILISCPIPNHKQKSLGFKRFRLPNTEKFAKEVMSLPMYPELTDEQVKYVCEVINNFEK